MNDPSDLPDGPAPRDLRFLKWLVIILTSTMILGLITIIGLLVTRLTASPAPLALPAGVTLPENARPDAVTFTQTHILVVTIGGEVLVFDRATGTLRQRIELVMP